MLYYSMWLLLVVLCGVALMFVVTKKVGSSSAHFFLKQQIAVGKTEGFVEEIMNGQKVVKVFSHETETKRILTGSTTSCLKCPVRQTVMRIC